MTTTTDVTTAQSDSEGLSGAENTTDQTGAVATAEAKEERKAARYRAERNEARVERDALAQRVERMQRAEVERLAADGLSHPADLFSLSGNDLADYLTEDGDVDADMVAADVAAVLAERPGLRKQSPAYDPTQGLGGSKSKAAPTWGDLLNS